jgi:hypothetical protein
MMGEGRTSRKEQDSRHRHQTQNCLFRLHLSTRHQLLG